MRYQWATVLVLALDRPLSDTYWLTMTDEDCPFVAAVEQTNFRSPAEYGGQHVVYLSNYVDPDDPIEVVTVRAEATGTPALRWDEVPVPPPSGDPGRPDRPVLTAEGPITAAGWWRPALAPGDEVVGPAVIEEPEATTYLGPGERALVDESGALEVTW